LSLSEHPPTGGSGVSSEGVASAGSSLIETSQSGVGVANFATLTLAALVLDRLFALTLIVLVSAVFSARKELDAYLLAFAGPAMLAAIIADLVYSLLLPEFVNAQRQEGPTDERWNISIWAVAILALITALYMICWAAGLSLTRPGSDRNLLMELGLLTSPMIFLAGFGTVGATLLVAQHRYVAASLRIPIASITTAASFLVLSRIDTRIEMLAISVISGSLIAAAVMGVTVFRMLGRPSTTISIRWSIRLLRRLAGASVAQIFSGLVAQAPMPIERLVGISLGAGVVSSLNYGRALANPPLLVGSSIATASYPRFVGLKANEDFGRYDTLGRSIGMVVFLLLPVTVLIAGLSGPLVQLVYHRGAFDEQAVTRTTVTAAILAGALVPIAVCGIVSRFLYAEHASRRVALASIATLAIYSLSAVVGARAFGYVGLAMASTGSYLVMMASLLLMVRRDSPRGLAFLPGRNLLRSAVASISAGVAVVGVAAFGGGDHGPLASLLTVVAAGGTGGVFFMITALAMRTPELRETLNLGRRSISRLYR
jgi:putative peptidoglycan lipid II flippase